MPRYLQHFFDLFSQSPPALGVADIFACDSLHSASRAGAFALVMNFARSENDEHPIHKVLVIAPPLHAFAQFDGTTIRLAVVEAAEAHFGRTLTEDEHRAIDHQVKTIHSDDLRVASVLKVLKSATSQSAVLILKAASYRAEGVTASHRTTAAPKLPEDLWLPHLLALAPAVTEIAKNVPCYVLMDTGEPPPLKPENQAALESVPDCNVIVARRKDDPWPVIASHAQEWEDEVKAGNIGSAFRSIDALPDWMNDQKSFLKLQLIGRTAPSQEALKLLRSEIATKAEIGPEARLKLARIAQRADDENLASDMLGPAISGLTAKEDLELALAIAVQISDQSMIDAILARLETLFPGSARLIEHRLTQMLHTRNYGEVLTLIDKHPSTDPELKFLHQTLALALQSADTPDYANALRAIEQTVPDHANWARIVCAHDAVARRDFNTAIGLCGPTAARPLTSGTARMLLRVTRELLLDRNPDGTLAVSGEQLQEPVSSLIMYLSAHPEDGRTRLILASVLSIETSGSLGLAAIIAVTLRLAGTMNPPYAKLKQQKPNETDNDLEITPFLERAMEWMSRESPLNLAVAKLPRTLLTGPPDVLFGKVKNLIEFDHDLRDAHARDAFEKIVYIGVLLAAHTNGPNEDIDLLRYAGARLITVNRLQRARDLAEHALGVAGNAPERRRLAWFAYADIYHRAHNVIESLIGMACVFALDVYSDLEQIWHETYLFIRILRDLRFTDLARSALDVLRQLTECFESRTKYQQRLTTLELGLRVSDLTRKGEYGLDALMEITRDVEKHCVDLMSSDEQIAPAVALLSHCVYLHSFLRVTPNDSAISTLKTMIPKLPHSQAAWIETVVSKEAGPEQLLALAKSIEGARNAEDIAFDLRDVAVAARRFLDTRSAGDGGESSILAIELLTDHAIRGGTPDSPLALVEKASELASETSRAGIRVVFLGLGESGRLVRVNVEAGRVQDVVCEAEETFSVRKLERWSKRYPYGYAFVDNPMNLFYVSTSGLGVSLLPSPATILIMDTSLQRLPPNLVRFGDEFAGRTTPIASAPSMSWLWAATKSLVPRTDHLKAWISTETAESKSSALAMVADRLQESLDQYKIALDTGAEPPGDLNDSELVVIAAHGGILPEGRYLQRLADDAEMAMYPARLANAVSGSSIVILFVCSGGRIDPHPIGETTVGLVKELFDQGCSTVIASPWPLEVGVPPNWLPVFLKEWMAGKTPIEATFLANKNVENRLGDSPLQCLAMNVYGDPLRLKYRPSR